MRSRALATCVALLAVQACDLTGVVEGDCLAAVQVGGVTYIYMGAAEEGFSPGPYRATVARQTECRDMVVAGDGETAPSADGLADGESNFLPVGTRLYEVPGYPPTERLAADTDYGWEIVAVEPEIVMFTEDGVRVRLHLDAAEVVPPVTLTAHLAYDNMLATAVTVTSSMGCPAFVGVYRETTRIPFPETDYACTAAFNSWTLEPGESLESQWPLEIGPDATPLAPGTYRFVADLNTHARELEATFVVR